MPEHRNAGGRGFKRGLGYRRVDVDRYLDQVDTARAALEAEVVRLGAAEPLTRVGDEIASLLTSFAVTVSTLRDQINEDAERRRREAEEYATRRIAEADQVFEAARAQATEAAQAMIRKARQEVADLAGQQLTIADALEKAAVGIAVSRAAIAEISQTAHNGTVVIPPPQLPSEDIEARPRTGTTSQHFRSASG